MSKAILMRAFTRWFNDHASIIYTDVFVAAPGYFKDADHTPSPAKAIWDTGATNTVITKSLVGKLGLTPTGVTQTRGVHGVKEVNTYFVDIKLPDDVAIDGVKVTEVTELMSDFELLIGMDIIGLGDFAITNCDQKTVFTFRFPSLKEINFVPSSIAHNKRLVDREKRLANSRKKNAHQPRRNSKKKKR